MKSHLDFTKEDLTMYGTTGVEKISLERLEQKLLHNYPVERDVTNNQNGELTAAAITYLMQYLAQKGDYKFNASAYWPWEMEYYKPSDDQIKNLAKAGAFIAAEIDRIKAVKEEKVK
jgi:hypothetical protein